MLLTRVDTIIIHCTATPRGRAVMVADVDRWHRDRGWNGIGYHFLIGLNGEVWEGRPLNVVGAHCQGYNAHSIGIAYVGGLEEDGKTPCDTRTDAQKKAMRKLVCDLDKVFGKRLNVIGHRDLDRHKNCPCFNAKPEFMFR